MRLRALALLAPVLALAVTSAQAAESYDNCTGFIDSLPVSINTQGVWCLRQDLSTAVSSGAAILIATNNVTIDCNDFKIGGLGAGTATQTAGIRAVARQNAVVRRCNLRGFLRGVEFTGAGGGHVVHDNRFNGITGTGLHVEGEGSVVQRNLLTDTGGSTFDGSAATAIFTSANVDVIANTISGVLPAGGGSGNGIAYGIRTSANTGGTIAGNRIRGLVAAGSRGGLRHQQHGQRPPGAARQRRRGRRHGGQRGPGLRQFPGRRPGERRQRLRHRDPGLLERRQCREALTARHRGPRVSAPWPIRPCSVAFRRRPSCRK
ncbi:right-handed parallel beta-helix repeat-containing protein [Agrilutibacter solisilvae]|uniref:right-handed parallel beta-helix repeat-containing protein n=1 Tax=Agrilutibacter solisilvae TaxID=2763317 RepID=UPI001FD64CA8|nr:right-handed parallel beta-helix repeat-containing protein [Lysobacter solisilvae]